MKTRRNILISILVGILYWFCGVVINYINQTLYGPSVLVLLPFIVGLTIPYILSKESKYRLIIYCFISILIKHIITFIRAMAVFYNDESYNYMWESVNDFLVLGPIQMVFVLIGIFLAMFMKQKRKAGRLSVNK